MSSEFDSSKFIPTSSMTAVQSMVASVGSALSGGISGLSGAVSGAIGGAIGSATGAIGGLAGGLLSGGASIGGMLSQATGALDKLVSGAEASFFANSPERIAADKLSSLRGDTQKSKSPAELIKNSKDATIGKPGLSFPSDIEVVPYFFRLQFMKYKRPLPLGETTSTTEITITLPLPSELHEGFQMQYNDIELGPIGGLVNEAQKNFTGASDAQDVIRNISEQFSANGSITRSAAGYGYVFGMEALKGTPEGATIGQFVGAVPNPHPSVAFQGMTLRTHQFNWTLVPRDESESATIKNIINELRKKTLPSFESSSMTNILDYPYMIKPSIIINGNSDSLYKFKLCVCDTFNVNYSPGQKPAFYGKDDSPVAVELTMSLKEIEYFTASDYGVFGGQAAASVTAAGEFLKNTIGGGGSAVSEGAPRDDRPAASPPGPR